MSGLLDWLYPHNTICPFCNQEAVLDADGVCSVCREGLVVLAGALRTCEAPLDGLSAGLAYAGPAKDAIRRLKYNGQYWLAPALAAYMALPPEWAVDGVVPVPLHPLRRWLRSYNQSQELAIALEKRGLAAPLTPDVLKRIRYTGPQARLSAAARRKNLQDAFRAVGSMKGKNLLLIDDVATTRSTLYACAAALKAAGASRVYALCAADADFTEETGGSVH